MVFYISDVYLQYITIYIARTNKSFFLVICAQYYKDICKILNSIRMQEYYYYLEIKLNFALQY